MDPVLCPACNTKVVPMRDGICSACRVPMTGEAAPSHNDSFHGQTPPVIVIATIVLFFSGFLAILATWLVYIGPDHEEVPLWIPIAAAVLLFMLARLLKNAGERLRNKHGFELSGDLLRIHSWGNVSDVPVAQIRQIYEGRLIYRTGGDPGEQAYPYLKIILDDNRTIHIGSVRDHQLGCRIDSIQALAAELKHRTLSQRHAWMSRELDMGHKMPFGTGQIVRGGVLLRGDAGVVPWNSISGFQILRMLVRYGGAVFGYDEVYLKTRDGSVVAGGERRLLPNIDVIDRMIQEKLQS